MVPRVSPRLVATDLDGTLLSPEGTVSAYTRQVLDDLDRCGVPVVFVTGRPIRWMDQLWDAVGGHGVAICSNGAITYDVATHTISQARTIAPGTLFDVADRLRRELPGTTFALEKTGGFAREPEFLPGGHDPRRSGDVPVGELDRIVDDTVVKILARHPDWAPEPYWDRVGVRGRPGHDHLVGHRNPGGDEQPRGDQGRHPGGLVRGPGDRPRRCGGLRRHAQRHRAAAMGGHRLCRGQRASPGAGRRRPGGAGQP